jgi:hypothetical protein
VVVNASNDDKDWAWLNAVRDGEVRVDNQRPGRGLWPGGHPAQPARPGRRGATCGSISPCRARSRARYPAGPGR